MGDAETTIGASHTDTVKSREFNPMGLKKTYQVLVAEATEDAANVLAGTRGVVEVARQRIMDKESSYVDHLMEKGDAPSFERNMWSLGVKTGKPADSARSAEVIETILTYLEGGRPMDETDANLLSQIQSNLVKVDPVSNTASWSINDSTKIELMFRLRHLEELANRVSSQANPASPANSAVARSLLIGPHIRYIEGGLNAILTQVRPVVSPKAV
jgi:hypothetical protein